MLWFIPALILIICGIAAAGKGKISTKYEDFNLRAGGFVAIIIGCILLFMSVFTVVPANTVGIPVTFGKPGSPLNSGMHFLAPWTNVEEFSTRVQSSDRTASEDEGDKKRVDCVGVKANDGSAECVDITVRYTIDPDEAGTLYRRYGDFDRVNEVLIRRITSDTAATTFNLFTPEQTIAGGITEANKSADQKLLDLRSTFRDNLNDALIPFGIKLDSVSIGEVTFTNPQVQERIDNKIKARQEAETALIAQTKAVTEAETSKKVAEQKAEESRIAAQGEADANNIRSAALTPEILQQQYYEALGKAGTIITDGSTPIIVSPNQATATQPQS